MVSIVPFGSRILFKEIIENNEQGLRSMNQTVSVGRVISVGEEISNIDSIPPVVEGDLILYNNNIAVSIMETGEELKMISIKDVIGKLIK